MTALMAIVPPRLSILPPMELLPLPSMLPRVITLAVPRAIAVNPTQMRTMGMPTRETVI